MTFAENELLEEFVFLQKKIKEIDERLDEIKLYLKTKGSFCTGQYACVVYEQQRRAICGLEEAIIKLGVEQLERLEMIKHSKFLVVKVARMGIKETADL